jgi:cysteine-S-conjugate beta-lyase
MQVHWRTKLIQSRREVPQGFRSLAAATYRGSTVVFESQAKVSDDWRQSEYGYTYGSFGTPTTLELGWRIAELEGAQHTFITPGGLAGISLIYLAFCKAGSHVLLPATAYGPNNELADGLLRRYNIEVERYDPLIGSGIEQLIRPETSLIWCESPGSITMEVQDIPSIVSAAHAKGIPVALDNSYAAGVLFDAFSFGVDVSMQALTKYVGGHSDLLLGSVSAGTTLAYERLGKTLGLLGMVASPDDCNLAMRGLQTLGVRLEVLERSTLAIATWLAQRPEIEIVLHPAFSTCPGHEYWKRDFTGSASIFSIVFAPSFSPEQVNAFVDTLKLFKIGYSWGGVTSLALAYPLLERPGKGYAGRIVRLNIGLEDHEDLIDDLAAGFATLVS